MRIWDLPKTEQDAILFFQERNILPKKRKCTNSHDMKLYFGKRKFWKCNLRQCDQQVGLRKDNWFEKSRIPFCSALRFIYCWCEELTSNKFCENQLDLSEKTVIDWNNYMRELCVLDIENKPNKKAVGVHCRMGRGRTGVMAACYLVKFHNMTPQSAMGQVRKMRPGSIETFCQEEAVMDYYYSICKENQSQ